MTPNISPILLQDINEKQTIQNGKKVCSQYRPLIQKRIKQLLVTPMNKSGFDIFISKSRINSTEKTLIERLAWGEDQITAFIRLIFDIEKNEGKIGEYLKKKYLYDMIDEDIAKSMKITWRTLQNYKLKAYYEIAVYTNQVEFIPLYTYQLSL